MKRILSEQVSKLVKQTVMMAGWAQTIRRHSQVVFIDLRDSGGLTQIVLTEELAKQAAEVTEESVIEVEGIVAQRPESLQNHNIISGDVEIQAKKLALISKADALPFQLDDDNVSEEVRLKYRYLDIRRASLTRNMRMRSKINKFAREWFVRRGFCEIETPFISKSTPEGARDFLVPSRIDPGKFYALPQSPQQYKQLLMVAGMEKYFQIVRCFRDEDSRKDRQPEFTQLDVEMSFATQEEILDIMECFFKDLVKEVFPEKVLSASTFPRLTYAEAMEKYKSDHPDLRKNKDNEDELAFAIITDFPMFEWKEKEKRYDAVHHPFTRPAKEWENSFTKKPREATAAQYDLVLNGVEIAGGSLRIHEPEMLSKVFQFLGHEEKAIEEKFGHLLKAFNFGVPPHGGFASGWDRVISLLLNEKGNIREVIAFPKMGDGKDPMMDAPSTVDSEQLKELGLKLEKKLS